MKSKDDANKERAEELLQLRARVSELEKRAMEQRTVEELLRESQEKFRTMVDWTYDWEYWLDPLGGLTYISPSCERVTGFGPKEFTDDPDLFSRIVHPADRATYDQHVAGHYKADLQNEEASLEFRIIAWDGTEHWIEHICRPVYDADGAYLGRRVSNREISDRKRARGELQKLASAVNYSGELVNISSLDGKMIFLNEAGSRMLGIDPKEVEEHQIVEVIPEKFQSLVQNELLPQLLAGRTWEGELQYRNVSTGKVTDVQAMFFTIEDPASGNPILLANVSLDITRRKLAEEALQAETERFRVFFENAPFGMVMISKEGTFEYVNPKFKEIFGYDLSDVPSGREWFQKAYPDRAYRKEIISAWIEDMKEVATGETRPRIFEVTCKDGRKKMIHFRPVKLATGQDLMTCEDITERRLAEEAVRRAHDELEVRVEESTAELRKTNEQLKREIADRKKAQKALEESEECYRDLVENLNDIIFSADNQGVLTYVSPSVQRVLEYEPSELVGRHFASLIHQEDLAAFSKCFHDALNYDIYTTEYRFLTKSGDWCWVQSSGRPTVKHGKILGIQGVARDISERKKAEEATRKSEERLLLALEGANLGTWDGDLTTGKMLWPERTYRILGYDPNEFEPNLNIWEKFVSPEDWPNVSENLNLHLEGNVPAFEAECRILNKFRDWQWVQIRGKVIEYDADGKPVRMLGILADATERKQAEQALRESEERLIKAQKMEAIGTLTGGIAHDFNNLLTVILGFAELLLMDMDEDNPSREDLQRIIAAASSGASLVQRLLTYSRQAETCPEPLDVKHEVEQVRELLLRTIPKMISLDLRLAEDVASFYGDSKQIQQVVMNLALNAADAMPDAGKLTIGAKNVVLDNGYCTTHPGVQPGDYVLLTISDTGRGMDRKTMERMYDPFFSTKARGSDRGTGLGLAVVHGIVDQHRGHVTCDSAPGKGTRFELYFPAMRTERQPEDIPEKPVAPGGTETILLVDDEAFVRDLGERILTRAGYKVLTASNGREALDMYRKSVGKISLVVLDLVMPVMGGRQCIPELSKVDPRVKILVSTGYSSDDDESEQTSSTVPLGFIRKPFAVSSLLQTVREVLDRA